MASAAQPPVEIYKTAMESLRAGQHDQAAAGFREFLRLHGGHELADNAQYWIGECHYDRKDYLVAVREFRRVVEKYPHGNKVPDALLKVGFSHLAVGNVGGGKQALEQLVKSHPRHEASALATAKLAELNGNGRPVTPRPVQEVP
jgi:tol-pal system protein YbgF